MWMILNQKKSRWTKIKDIKKENLSDLQEDLYRTINQISK